MTIELTLLSRVSYRGQEITGPRLRGLLALLADDLRAGCSIARLVEGLWPEEQPDNPTKALQVLVSRARSQLGSDVIASTPTGYRLALGEDQVDASAALLHATTSAQRSRAGDHATALEHAEAGLALWDGDPGRDGTADGSASDDPVQVLRAERTPTYGTLARARALALARLGRHAEAIEPLAELFAERPRDEEILLDLLRSEAATAGPSAALTRYDEYRRSLRDELGADPGAALQAGYQQLLQSETPAVRHGIPHEPNPLLGRADDIDAVTNLLRTSRVTSIVGPGGLGKTRLAQIVSREAEQRIVHLVALAGIATDDDVVREVASALGVGESRLPISHLAIPTDVLTGIAGALGPGPALLVLDNCEHVLRGAAELVRALVSMTRDLRVLTTSRSPLGLSSEAVYLLPELDLSTTVDLFGQRARAARPGVELPADAVAALAGHLDGLPLAVELAAARVRVMSVPEIARRLEDGFAVLRGGARDAPQRHQALHAVVDWSWNLLEPGGQAAMRALSVYTGGFTADAAERLLDDADALLILEDLVDQSLLKVADTATGIRFQMLETVREYSAERREAAGEDDLVSERFLAWAREFGLAHHESIFGPDPFRCADRIRTEQDNLLQALRWGVARADGGTVAAVAALLGGLWMVESNYNRLGSQSQDVFRILSHYRPEPDLVEVTRTAATVSVMYTFLLERPRAVRAMVVLRRLPPAPPNTLIRASAIVLTALWEGDSRGSGLQELCDSDEPLLAGAANGAASYLREGEGDLEGALEASRRMTFGDAATPWLRIIGQSRLGELCVQAGRSDEARRHLMSAVATLTELGARPEMLDEFRVGLVLVSLQRGAVDEAEDWLDQTSQNHADVEIGNLTFDLGVRAEIALARGQVDLGLGLWRRAVDRLRNTEGPVFGFESVRNPWALEIESVTVIAHAHHGRLDLVEELTSDLPDTVSELLSTPPGTLPPAVMEFPICGAQLLALAMVDLDRGDTASGTRLIALAERFAFVRNFQPTMSPERARQTAEHADGPAYDDAVSSYAGLSRDELRSAAQVVLEARPSARGRG